MIGCIESKADFFCNALFAQASKRAFGSLFGVGLRSRPKEKVLSRCGFIRILVAFCTQAIECRSAHYLANVHNVDAQNVCETIAEKSFGNSIQCNKIRPEKSALRLSEKVCVIDFFVNLCIATLIMQLQPFEIAT